MSESQRLDQLFDQLSSIEDSLRGIAKAERDTTIITACDLAADYIHKAAWAALDQIQAIERAAIAAEEKPWNH